MWGKIELFYVFSHPTVFAMAHLSITDLLLKKILSTQFANTLQFLKKYLMFEIT